MSPLTRQTLLVLIVIGCWMTVGLTCFAQDTEESASESDQGLTETTEVEATESEQTEVDETESEEAEAQELTETQEQQQSSDDNMGVFLGIERTILKLEGRLLSDKEDYFSRLQTGVSFDAFGVEFRGGLLIALGETASEQSAKVRIYDTTSNTYIAQKNVNVSIENGWFLSVLCSDWFFTEELEWLVAFQYKSLDLTQDTLKISSTYSISEAGEDSISFMIPQVIPGLRYHFDSGVYLETTLPYTFAQEEDFGKDSLASIDSNKEFVAFEKASVLSGPTLEFQIGYRF